MEGNAIRFGMRELVLTACSVRTVSSNIGKRKEMRNEKLSNWKAKQNELVVLSITLKSFVIPT